MELQRSCWDATYPPQYSTTRRRYILPQGNLFPGYEPVRKFAEKFTRKSFLVKGLALFHKDDSFLGGGDCPYQAMSPDKQQQIPQPHQQGENSQLKWSTKQRSLNSRQGEDGAINNNKNKESIPSTKSATTDIYDTQLRDIDTCCASPVPKRAQSDISLSQPLTVGAVIIKRVDSGNDKDVKADASSTSEPTVTVALNVGTSLTEFGISQQSQSTIQKLQSQIADVQNIYKGSISHNTVENALQKLEGQAKDAHSEYRSIFQSAFNNLEDHVMDIQNTGRIKYHRGNVQKHPRLTNIVQASNYDHAPSLQPRSDASSMSYPDNLCSSLQIFQIQKFPPQTSNRRPQTSTSRLSAYERTSSRPETSCISLQQRRVSEPQNKYSLNDFPASLTPFLRRQDTRADSRNFDILSSRVLSHSVSDSRPLNLRSTYSDVTEKTSREENLADEVDERTRAVNGELGSTSGIDSDGGNSEIYEDFGDDIGKELDNDSASELENGNEPVAHLSTQLPDLHLRPEVCDEAMMQDSKRDFDFNDDSLDEPLYEFKCPIPTPFDQINLQQCAKEKSNWRQGNGHLGPVDSTFCAMIDRLVELEKVQIETLAWEERRIRLARKRPVSRSNKLRDACLKAACLGDCQNKRVETNGSEKSHDPVCADVPRDIKNKRVDSNCSEKSHEPVYAEVPRDFKNEQRMPQSAEEKKLSLHSRIVVSQVYNFCNKRFGTQCMVTNQSFQGRPKSAFHSFSRGKSPSTSKDTRPITASNVTRSLTKDIENLRLEPHQPTSSSEVKQLLLSNKGGTIPSKCYYSRNKRSQANLCPRRRC